MEYKEEVDRSKNSEKLLIKGNTDVYEIKSQLWIGKYGRQKL